MFRFLPYDRIFLLLFVNALLVVIGYAVVVASGGALLGMMKALKTLFLLISIGWVLLQKDARTAFSATKYTYLIFFLCLILPFFGLVSENTQYALNRIQTFLVPVIYVWLSTSILVYRYGQQLVLQMFSLLVMLVYSIPMLSYVLYGGSFSGTSIYGYSEEMVFISNHFGWSASLFLIAAFSYLNGRNIKLWTKLAVLLLVILAVYMLIVSGTRSAILSVALALMVVLFNYQRIPIYQKLIIVISPFLLILYLFAQENEAVLHVVERTQRQQESGTEGRLERFEIVISEMGRQPLLWLTGVGLFNYYFFNRGGEEFSGYHNSYFELLFGLGIPLFLLFMLFMLYEPLKQFLTRVSKYDLVFIPLAIIPFFESNLTAGQFLFFPWFCYIFALNAKKHFAFYGKRNWSNYYHLESIETTPPIFQDRRH